MFIAFDLFHSIHIAKIQKNYLAEILGD